MVSQATRGPDITAVWKRGFLQAASQRQSKAPGSATSLPPLLPVGLGKSEHVTQALRLQHPFDEPPVLESDLMFAASCVSRLGPASTKFRSRQWRLLRSLVRALRPLDEYALSFRPQFAKHRDSMLPVTVAVLV
eukprot:10023495-Karenia_brevis.AAC.1